MASFFVKEAIHYASACEYFIHSKAPICLASQSELQIALQLALLFDPLSDSVSR
jgi:hypothetical protein